jgi:hypothetical protein
MTKAPSWYLGGIYADTFITLKNILEKVLDWLSLTWIYPWTEKYEYIHSNDPSNNLEVWRWIRENKFSYFEACTTLLPDMETTILSNKL